jgi:hypothetical protein
MSIWYQWALFPKCFNLTSCQCSHLDFIKPWTEDLTNFVSLSVEGLSFNFAIICSRLSLKELHLNFVASFVAYSFDTTLKINIETTKDDIFCNNLRLLKSNIFIKLIKMNIKLPTLTDFYHSSATVELKFRIWSIIALNFIVLPLHLKSDNLSRNMLAFLWDKLDFMINVFISLTKHGIEWFSLSYFGITVCLNKSYERYCKSSRRIFIYWGFVKQIGTWYHAFTNSLKSCKRLIHNYG